MYIQYTYIHRFIAWPDSSALSAVTRPFGRGEVRSPLRKKVSDLPNDFYTVVLAVAVYVISQYTSFNVA